MEGGFCDSVREATHAGIICFDRFVLRNVARYARGAAASAATHRVSIGVLYGAGLLPRPSLRR
jgi:hypothetical protein